MRINHKTFPLLIALVSGIVIGVALQKFLPIGTIIPTTVALITGNPLPTPITEEEYQVRAEQARLAAQINRNDYTRIIHLYGDSIGRGKGMNEYENPNRLARIQDTAQLLLTDNGVSEKELYFRYAWGQDAAQMAAELKSGMIRDGDIIVYEDAGQHEENVELRRQRLQKIEQVVRDSGHQVQVVFTTMFDYQPSATFYNSNYDALVGNSGMTMNQVTEQVTASGASSLLDWNKQMDDAVVTLAPYGISPMLPDGVHPNVLGNVLLAATLVKYVGVPINNYQSIKQEFQRLPPTYYEIFEWAKPLDPSYLDPVLQALLKIAVTI